MYGSKLTELQSSFSRLLKSVCLSLTAFIAILILSAGVTLLPMFFLWKFWSIMTLRVLVSSLGTQAPLMLPPHYFYFPCLKEGGAWSSHVWLLNLEHPEHINYSCLFNWWHCPWWHHADYLNDDISTSCRAPWCDPCGRQFIERLAGKN